jgi:uncharacterized membrane protein
MPSKARTSPPAFDDHHPLGENIRAVVELEREAHRNTPWSDRLGIAVAGFAGSLRCLLFHLVLFGGWILLNCGVIPGLKPFDPYPFTLLVLCVSLEAILLSSFVLISQNRLSRLADERAHLDLQINLLAEQENTQALILLQDLCRHLKVPARTQDAALADLTRPTQPSQVVQAIQREQAD